MCNKMKISNYEKEIIDIVLNYSDGSKKVIKKGTVIETGKGYDEELDEETLDLSMLCCNLSGEDMSNLMYGMMNIFANLYGDKLLGKDGEDEEDGEQ